jgi:transposase
MSDRVMRAGLLTVEGAVSAHADPNTVMHCLYGYYFLGISKAELGRIYGKTERTVFNWVTRYEATGTYERCRANAQRKFTPAHRQWLLDYYTRNPLAFLDEDQAAFKSANSLSISKSSVWNTIHDFGLTWKVLERRAMHVKERDSLRFVDELGHVQWSHCNLVFLDEVSFDNRGM